jgi:hypothetical protein
MITLGQILGAAMALTAAVTPVIIWWAFRNPEQDASTKPKR